MTWFNNPFVFERTLVVMAIDVSLKVTIVAAIVLLLLKLLRTRDSATLHRANSFILLSMLLMPVLAFLAPRITLPLPTQLAFDLDPQSSLEPQTHSAASNDDTYHVSSAALNHLSQPALATSNPVSEPDHSPAKAAVASEPISTPEIDLSNAMPPTNWIEKLPFILLCVYGAVACAMLLRLAVGLLKCHTLLNRASLIPSEDLPDDLNSHIVVMESFDLQVPIAVGFWRPRILLPADWRTWNNNEVAMAMAHESEHIARGDTRVSFLASLNCTLYWFHPLSWALARRLSELAEHACDDAVISATDNRSAYALKLVCLASRLSAQSPRYCPVSLGMARQPLLEKRVMRIVDCERPLSIRVSWRKNLSLAALVLLLATFAGGVTFSKKLIADEAVAEQTNSAQAGQTNQAAESPDEAIKSTISGRVVSQQGEPAANVQVKLFTRAADGGRNSSQKTVTNLNGEFSFNELKLGKHLLVAFSGDMSSRTKRYDGTTAESGEQNVTLVLQKAPSLKVRVIDRASGHPIENALVRLTWTDTDRDHFTDSEGYVTLQGLTSELWTIEVQAKGYAEHGQAVGLSTDVTEIVAALEPGFELYGKITNQAGEPIGDVGISIFPIGIRGEQIEYITTKVDGLYRFPNVPMNGVHLSILQDGFERIEKDVTPTVLAAGEQKLDITLVTLPDGGSIAGVIEDELGAPIAGANIANSGSSSRFLRSTGSDSSGQFRLDNVYQRGGQHSILVRAKGFEPQLNNFIPGSRDKPNQLSVCLKTGSNIVGKVVDESGKPIEGVWVMANSFSSVLGSNLNSTYTDIEGRFALDSLLAEEKFNFDKTGYSRIQDAKLTLNGKEPVIVRLSEQGRLRGRVVDDISEQPISPFKVRITFSHQPTKNEPPASLSGPAAVGPGELFANQDGIFELKNLVQGMSLQVTINANGYERAVNHKIVVDNGLSINEFRLKRIEKTTTIAGQVLNSQSEPLRGVQVRLIGMERTDRPQQSPFLVDWSQIQRGDLERDSSVTHFLTAATDNEGLFKFENVPQGQRIQLAYWGDDIARDQVYSIDNLSSEDQQKLTIKAVAAGKVSGNIDRSDLPSDIHVLVSAKADMYFATISQDGKHYEIRNIPAGEYDLIIGTYSPQSPNGTFRSSTVKRTDVIVRSGETTTVDLPKN